MLEAPQIFRYGMVPGTQRTIESLASELLKRPQAEYLLRTFHAPGVYLREITMYAGTLIVGHKHKTEHFNIVAAGEALVVNGEQIERMVAPYTCLSHGGVQKVLFILRDCTWYTVHANPENIRDEETLDHMMIEDAEGYQQHKIERAERALKRIDHLFPDFKEAI
jgi:hypothetical protein